MVNVIFLALFGFVSQQCELQRYEASRPLMGVDFTLIIYAQNLAAAEEGFEAAFAEIEGMNASLSDYQTESEINRLCRSAPHDQMVEVSEQLFETMLLARNIFEQTDGAFDVSIGPASRLWRKARRDRRLPSDEEIAEAASKMGMDSIQLEFRDKKMLMRVAKEDMQLDFGGIAKGFAADRAMQSLKKLGIESALINASGDVLVSDPPPGKKGWTIQIPSANPQTPVTITIANTAVATSGDVFQYLEVDGVRYSHIVNPKTARAITDSRIVTVISQHGGVADAFASAVSVMGQRGLEFAEANKFEAQIIQATNKELTEFEVQRSPGFVQSLKDNSSAK